MFLVLLDYNIVTRENDKVHLQNCKAAWERLVYYDLSVWLYKYEFVKSNIINFSLTTDAQVLCMYAKKIQAILRPCNMPQVEFLLGILIILTDFCWNCSFEHFSKSGEKMTGDKTLQTSFNISKSNSDIDT